MTSVVDTMPLPRAQKPVLKTATAAPADADHPARDASTPALSASSSLVVRGPSSTTPVAACTTPTRLGGMAAVTPDMLDSFLCPRTPKALVHSEKSTNELGITPRFTPRLSPMNFVSDFGKNNKKEGNVNAFDASRGKSFVVIELASVENCQLMSFFRLQVLALLQSPGFQGLNSFSATNTPRGIYGFCATPGNNNSSFFSGLEEGGKAGVNTPHMHPNSQCRMMCIPPLASKEFSEVFAETPISPIPNLSRIRGGAPGEEIVGKNKSSISSSRVFARPVPSALHAAEQDVNLDDDLLDDDLNALMQVFETAPTANLSGSMPGKSVLPQNKTRRNGVLSYSNIGPSNLAVQSSTSSGVGDTAPAVNSSLKKKSKKKSKKRRLSTITASSDHPGSTTSPSAKKITPLPLKKKKRPSPVKSSQKIKSSFNKAPSSASSKTKKSSKARDPSKPDRPPSALRSTAKRVRKPSPKASSALSQHEGGVSSPSDNERIAAAMHAVNAAYGEGAEKEEKLAAVKLRGVTVRPSRKWVRWTCMTSGLLFHETLRAHILSPFLSPLSQQAQLYYSGKSRYIGVFGSKEEAALAYEIAREVLKADKAAERPVDAEEIERNLDLAKKAAFAGVEEHYSISDPPSQTKSQGAGELPLEGMGADTTDGPVGD